MLTAGRRLAGLERIAACAVKALPPPKGALLAAKVALGGFRHFLLGMASGALRTSLIETGQPMMILDGDMGVQFPGRFLALRATLSLSFLVIRHVGRRPTFFALF